MHVPHCQRECPALNCVTDSVKYLGPSRRGAFLVHAGFVFLSFSLRIQISDFRRFNICTIDSINIAMGGAVNFCLQKSRMPLAGLVYFHVRLEAWNVNRMK